MDKYEKYHGAALLRLIHKGIESIKLITGKNGYLINSTTYVYMKFSEKTTSPWRFTFMPQHIKELSEIRKTIPEMFIVLICGEDGICCLSYQELSRLIHIGIDDKNKVVTMHRRERNKYSVSGTDGTLNYKIGNTDFPKKIFDKPKIKSSEPGYSNMS
jgi:hypothetical protein